MGCGFGSVLERCDDELALVPPSRCTWVGLPHTSAGRATSLVRYTPAMEISSACRLNEKMRAPASPRAPAIALPRSGAYTWMWPSAMTSAPGLTMLSTTRSRPRAYTCWPERRGLSMTRAEGGCTGAGAVTGAVAGAAVCGASTTSARAVVRGTTASGAATRPAACAASICTVLPPRAAMGNTRYWRSNGSSAAKSSAASACAACSGLRSSTSGSLSKKSGMSP
jgi:hypothetical protein